MKKALYIIIIVLVSTNVCFCQGLKQLRFYDCSWEETDKLRKACYIENISNENDSSYQIKIFNVTGNLLMKGTFSKIKPLIPNGSFEFYNLNPQYVKCTGQYSNGEIVGEWKIYYKDSIRIVNYDSIMFHSCEEIEYEAFVHYEDMPSFRGNDPAFTFREFIAEERFYPPFEELFHLSGRVIIQFSIDKNGNVCNPEIIRNVSANFDKEALRILSKSPKWNPVNRIELFTFPFWFDQE